MSKRGRDTTLRPLMASFPEAGRHSDGTWACRCFDVHLEKVCDTVHGEIRHCGIAL